MKNKRAVRLLTLPVVFSVLFSLLMTLFVSAANKNDYSRPSYPGDAYNETLDSLELLRDKLNVSVGQTESLYLSERGELILSYPKNIPSSYVSLYDIGTNLVVSAKAYSYTSSDGVSVSWIPESVILESTGARLAFPALPDSSNEYVTSFVLEAPASPGLSFNISYKTEISISKDSVNSLLSKAYNDALYFDYLEKLLAYESAMKIYEQYLSDKRVYEELLGEYMQYLSDLEEYRALTEKYNAYVLALQKYEADYVLYLESLEKAEKLADEIAAYEAYTAKMDKINYRLSLIEDMKRKLTPLKRSLYAAITGDAVDQVLAEESLLTGNVINADKEAVRSAGDATVEIRAFYDGYFSLTDDVAKYRYYQVNYQSFKDNIVKLFKSLENLYRNSYVKSIIESKGKSEKYEILLAELYYASCALSDEPVYDFYGNFVFDSSYKINTVNGEKTPFEILGKVTDYYIDKNIATPPADEAYPAPVPKPDYTPFPEPQKPEKQVQPTEPEPVAQPTPPEPVAEPLRPDAVANPDGISAAAPFSPDSLEAKLLEQLRIGALSPRTQSYLSEDLKMLLTISVKKVFGAASVTVSYHDEGGNHIGDVETEAGTFAEVSYVPEKSDTPDGRYCFVFEKWVDEDGRDVDLSAVSRDLRIYPKFKQQIKEFTVSWSVDGTLSSVRLPYGEIPVYLGTPEKAGDLNKYYVFSSWTPEILPVTEDICYTAQFTEIYTVPELAFDAITKPSDTALSVDASGALGKRLNISKLLEIASGKYSLIFNFSDANASRTAGKSAVLSVSYADVIAMKKAGASYLSFDFTEANGAPEYCFSVYDKNGEPCSLQLKASLSVSTSLSGENMRVVYYENGVKNYVKYTYSDGKISFNLNTGRHYSYIFEVFAESITVLPQDNVSISTDKTVAKEGENVSVSASVPPGWELIALYYVDEGGTKVYIEGGSFVMPASAVSVGAEHRKIPYTVIFVSDGMIISSATYYYGDTVDIPEGVEKANDENYSYTFKRWTPSVVSVVSDARYEAVYERTPLVKEDDGGLKISEGTLRILVTAGIVGTVSVFGILPSAILSVILAVKRRRRGMALIGKRKKL